MLVDEALPILMDLLNICDVMCVKRLPGVNAVAQQVCSTDPDDTSDPLDYSPRLIANQWEILRLPAGAPVLFGLTLYP